eukprot:1417559-Alexandrium_andersonii.AAC.1
MPRPLSDLTAPGVERVAVALVAAGPVAPSLVQGRGLAYVSWPCRGHLFVAALRASSLGSASLLTPQNCDPVSYTHLRAHETSAHL